MKIVYYQKACSCNSSMKSVFDQAVKEAKVTLESFEEISDESAASKAGIPELPAAVINGELVFSGFLPTYKKLIKIIKKKS